MHVKLKIYAVYYLFRNSDVSFIQIQIVLNVKETKEKYDKIDYFVYSLLLINSSWLVKRNFMY
jgi:hypothetical protein